LEASIGLFGEEILKIFGMWLPVVSELASPVEVIDIINSDLDHVSNDFSGMYIEYNKGTHAVSLELVKVTSDKIDHTSDLLN